MPFPSALRSVGIAGVGAYAPPRRLTNEDLSKIVDTSDEWIRSRTGIRERRIMDPGTTTSDMGVIAARKALASAAIAPADVDLIVVATATPDMVFPATSCIIQHRIGAVKAACFDLEAGCTGFIYALSVGAQFIMTGAYDRVLVIGTDALSTVTNWKDRNTCVLFGDAAGAVVLTPAGTGEGILSLHLGADGSGAELLKVPAGGSRLPASRETVDKDQHYLQMAGSEVFKFAVKVMGEAALEALRQAGITTDEVTCFVPHQANIRIIEAAAKRLGIGMDRVFVNVAHYGNTSCASIPLALSEALEAGRIKQGDVVVIVGFGAGLTWGAGVVRWTNHVQVATVDG